MPLRYVRDRLKALLASRSQVCGLGRVKRETYEFFYCGGLWMMAFVPQPIL